MSAYYRKVDLGFGHFIDVVGKSVERDRKHNPNDLRGAKSGVRGRTKMFVSLF